MLTDSDMAFDDEQSDLFDRLAERGLNAKQLVFWLDLSERQARRIMTGDSPLSARHVRQFMRHAQHNQSDLVDDYIGSGGHRLSIDMDGARGQGIDADMVETMRELTDLLAQRLAHAADGVITVDERDIELNTVRACIRTLHALHGEIADQRTTRKARPLVLAGDGPKSA